MLIELMILLAVCSVIRGVRKMRGRRAVADVAPR